MPSPTGPRRGLTLAAAGLLLLEGLGVLALAVWEIIALIGGDGAMLASSIALIVMTVLAAAAVGAFGVSVIQGSSWGRSGGIVTQVMIFAIAIGAMTGEYANRNVGALLMIPAVVTFVLLITASRRPRPEVNEPS